MQKSLSLSAAALFSAALLFPAGNLRAASAPAEQNWPQWRGPLGTGVAPAANPPVTWSETNNIKWKVAIPGEGSASPVIWDNQVFIMTAIPTGKKAEAAGTPAAAPPANPPAGGRGGFGGGGKPTEAFQFVVMSLDRQTGKPLWQKTACEVVPHEGHHADGSFASASPVTDGQWLYAFFGSRGLYCYDLSGQLQWSTNFGQMRIMASFGEGSSPALHGDTLVVNWDNEDNSFVTALDAKTGRTLWRVPRDEKTSWATPLVVEHNGKAQVVVSATGKIRSYDLATGKVIWECGGMTRNVIPSPVADADTVYCISGFGGSSLLAIRLGRTGDLTGTDAIAWSYKKNTPYVPSQMLAGNRLYFFKVNDEVLTCVDVKTGNPLIDGKRIEGLKGVYAAPLGAADRVYLAGRNGGTVVLKQADTLEVLATNQLNEKFDASPAAVGKELFLRGKGNLYCIAEK